MQLTRTKFQKSFILSTKNWIKCFPGKNPVNSRGKSGDITLSLKSWKRSSTVLFSLTFVRTEANFNQIYKLVRCAFECTEKKRPPNSLESKGVASMHSLRGVGSTAQNLLKRKCVPAFCIRLKVEWRAARGKSRSHLSRCSECRLEAFLRMKCRSHHERIPFLPEWGPPCFPPLYSIQEEDYHWRTSQATNNRRPDRSVVQSVIQDVHNVVQSVVYRDSPEAV